MIALFSLRVRAIIFAMITLAVASAVAVLVSQLSGLTGGEDGMTLTIPRELTPAFRFAEGVSPAPDGFVAPVPPGGLPFRLTCLNSHASPFVHLSRSQRKHMPFFLLLYGLQVLHCLPTLFLK